MAPKAKVEMAVSLSISKTMTVPPNGTTTTPQLTNHPSSERSSLERTDASNFAVKSSIRTILKKWKARRSH